MLKYLYATWHWEVNLAYLHEDESGTVFQHSFVSKWDHLA